MQADVGTLVASRYRVAGRFGQGGMGVVYRATDEQLHRTVALKFLPAGSEENLGRLSRFRNEARTLAALNHPHIVSIFEVGEDGGEPFFVMEAVEGETLRARLGRGPLPVGEALDVGLQIARGLAAAHEKGLIHRDIKPENVMIRRDGYVKILDFGIAMLRASDFSTSALTVGALETVAGGVIGTPAYMAPEQMDDDLVDARTDIFGLGLLLCEAIAGRNPFVKPGVLDTAAVIRETPAPAAQALRDAPADVRAIVIRALERDPARRYPSAADMIVDLRQAMQRREQATGEAVSARRRGRPAMVAGFAAALVLLTVVAGLWYRQAAHRQWVHEQAVPRIAKLLEAHQTAAALPVITEAEGYVPADAALTSLIAQATRKATVTSTPSGATVEVQDYATPDQPWLTLGVTPLTNVRVPSGYLRWRVTKAGVGQSLTAPLPADTQSFDLDAVAHAPAGMVPVPAGLWQGFYGVFGAAAYELPAYDIDRLEVTNRQYQAFVDAGGYGNRQYWTEPFRDGARTLEWSEAIGRFHDTTDRPGPATWVGGHYSDGQADWPVTGVSWYEAAAYSAWAGRSLPVIWQNFKAAPTRADQYALPLSNMSDTLQPAGRAPALGAFGTYDLIGNAREWIWNENGAGMRYALGRLPSSYAPEGLPPFDRSALNGFRCVLNHAPVSAAARAPKASLNRDFSKTRPASDEVFQVYRNVYAYDRGPLDAVVDPVRTSTEDWTVETVTFRTAYGDGRMAAYLFLPKRAKPPYQTLAFFPSARVNGLRAGAPLGDLQFMDYVVQSGRAVIYPVYDGFYERWKDKTPGETLKRERAVNWSKDLGRALDYLETRPDIDHDRFGYLGVSQGAAYGVILSALEPRLKTVVLLDGGFFRFEHPIAGLDQVDFAPRIHQPVLMVNGKYDQTFPLETSQNPLFERLGAADKFHRVFETPHDVTVSKAELIREVLGWLDKHLGPVR